MADESYSINPKLWGPMMWYLLHTLAYAYQPVLMNYYQTFFHIIFSIFPCHHCQYHYTQHLYKSPPNLKSAESLSKWVVMLHNNVNQFKKKRVYSVAEAKELYYHENELLFNHKFLADLLIIICESNIEMNSIINILQILAHIIPCGECSVKLVQYMQSKETIQNIYKDNFEKVIEDFIEILDLHTDNIGDSKYLMQKFQINPETAAFPPVQLQPQVQPQKQTRNLNQLFLNDSELESESELDTPLIENKSNNNKNIKHTIQKKILEIKQFNKFNKKYITLSEKLTL